MLAQNALAKCITRRPYRGPVAVHSSGNARVTAISLPHPASTLSDDLQLFLSCFLGGLVFMSVYLA